MIVFQTSRDGIVHSFLSMVGNAIILDEKKHQDDENWRKSFSNQRKRIYLVNNIFEARENAKIEAGCKRCSDSDFAAICCLWI